MIIDRNPQIMIDIKKSLINFLFCSLMLQTFSLFAQIDRIEDSNYPASFTPDTLWVIQDLNHSDDELFLIQSLQGILAKTQPKIYRERGSGSTIWLNDLCDNYGITRIDSLDNIYRLIEKFKSSINGYILCNSFDHTSNIAISLSGFTGGITVPQQLEDSIIAMDIPLLYDVRDKDYQWFIDNFSGSISKRNITYQKEEKAHFLGDYSIFTNAFHFYSDIHSNITETAFGLMDQNATLYGWGDDEYQTIRKASEFGIGVHPADWAFNLSTLTNFNVSTQQKESINGPAPMIDGKHNVCFLISDGDNIQWMLNLFADDNRWFGSNNRGQIPIGWTIPPAMCELAPTVMHKLYDMAANTNEGRDYFVAGPSGNTYNFPEFFPDLDAQAKVMNDYLQKSDLSIVNILGNDDAPSVISKISEMDAVEGIFYYDYGNYSKGEGKISCYDWKPIINSSYNLWGGFETCQSIAEKVNQKSRDPKSPDAYTLVAVHAWSNSVDSLLLISSLLDQDVRIVAPDDFVRLVKENICNQPKESLIFPNPTDGSFTVRMDRSFENIRVSIHDLLGKKYASKFQFNSTVNESYINIEMKEKTNGVFIINIEADGIQYLYKIMVY